MNKYKFNQAHLFRVLPPLSIPDTRSILDRNWSGYWHRHLADHAPKITVPVYRFKQGKPLHTGRERTIYGISTFHERPRIVEVTIAEPRSIRALTYDIDQTFKLVQKANPSLKLCPSHSGWVKRLPGGKVRLDLLFAITGEEHTSRSRNYSRRNSLDFHLGDESRLLCSLDNVHVARGDSPIADHDGVIYVRQSSLPVNPVNNPVKVIGYADFSPSQLKDQKPVLKGMLVSLDDSEWMSLSSSCGLDSSANCIVPECTVKFDDGSPVWEEVKIFQVFHSVISTKVSLSVQAAERVPLTEYGRKVIEATFRERVREIMDAYRDPTGQEVARLLFRELTEIAENRGTSCEDDSLFIDKMESLSSVYTALLTGLPVNDSDFINSTLPTLLRNRVKHITLPGLTIAALPDSSLEANQVIMPFKDAIRLGIRKGDAVTLSRYPCTGLELAEAQVVGFTKLEALLVNPLWWAQRFAGDFDGDLIGLLPLCGIVNETAIGNETSAKLKASGEMTIAESISRSFFAKLTIPLADELLTICAEEGIPLSYPRQILQSVVDSIKHVVDIPSIEEARMELGLSQESKASPCARLIRGKLGYMKKEFGLRYAAQVNRMSDSHSGISWMRNIENEFCYILSPNRKYAELVFEKSDSNLRSEYEDALTHARQYDLKNLAVNKESVATLPKELLTRTRKGAAREAERIRKDYPEAVSLARTVLRQYFNWINLLQEDQVEEAYAELRSTRELLYADEEIGGLSLRFLFISIVYQIDSSITLQSMKIFSHMPVSLGCYDLQRYIKNLNYQRTFDARVIPTSR